MRRDGVSPPGVYLYRLVGNEVRLTRSMVLLDGAVGSTSAGPVGKELVGATQVYGLTVSGQGLIPYVDPAFRAGADAVNIVVEVLDSVPQDKGAVSRLLGDLDNNGRVDWADALLAVLYSEDSSIALPNNGDISLGDVSQDGQIDLADAPTHRDVQHRSIRPVAACGDRQVGGSVITAATTRRPAPDADQAAGRVPHPHIRQRGYPALAR